MTNRSRPAGAASGLIAASKSSLSDGTDISAEPREPAARKRCTQIQVLLKSMAKKTNEVFNLLDVAKMRDDHIALGYASWTAYVAGEYAGLLADLNRPQRREVVSSMTAIGMPTRAIATVLDVDHSTVVRDQRQVVQVAPPDREDDAERREDDADRRVTGVDGKTYKATSKPVVEPGEPRRSSLPDQYRSAINELDKAVRRLEKLHADDRFRTNRKTLSIHHGLLLEHERKVGTFAFEVSDAGGVR